MARIRTIKPDFWGDFRLAQELSRDVRLFYIALWNQADDEGRFLAHPRRLLGAVFPYDEDISAADIREWLEMLALTGRLTMYEVDGEPYAQLTKFPTHQKINRPQASRIPAPPSTEDSRRLHGTFTEDSLPEVEREEEGITTTVDKSTDATRRSERAPQDDDPPAVPPQPQTPDVESVVFRQAVAGAVRKHCWVKGRPPFEAGPKWDMPNELSIAKQLVAGGGVTLEELVGAIEVGREVLGVEGAWTLALFNGKAERQRLSLCVAEWQARALADTDLGDLTAGIGTGGRVAA